jgi:putative transposase
LALRNFVGITFQGKRLYFNGMNGGLRVHVHRQMPEGKILSCQFRRDTKVWHACFQMRVPINPLSPVRQSVGIDMGLSSLAVLTTGEHIPTPQVAKRCERELRRRQRHLTRCRKGSVGGV